jgi:pyruvate kinase
MMDRMVREAEAGVLPREIPVAALSRAGVPAALPEVIAAAAAEAARVAGAVAIACFTRTGDTARLLARLRPGVPVIAFSPDQSIRRRLALYWGVVPRVMEPVQNTDLMAVLVSRRLLELGLVAPSDRVVLVFGTPLGIPGKTNSIRLHEIEAPGAGGPEDTAA